MSRCAICTEPAENGFCKDIVECNYRSRLRLGVPRHVCNQWRARERWRYPRSRGGKR